MFALLVAMLLQGAPVKAPDVTSVEQVKAQMGQDATVVGLVERVEIRKGKGEWQGTGVVLDDDTVIYVTYSAPPEGWAPFVGQRVRVSGRLGPTSSETEQSLMAPHLRPSGLPKKEPRALSSLVGKRVRLSGVARDAKGGAVLLVDGSPVYLQALESWPSHANGKVVSVGGTLVSKEYLPKATRDAKGAISQGTEGGDQLVFESPTWRVNQEPK